MRHQRYLKLLEKDVVLIDGALGTELEKAIATPLLPWSLDGLVLHPDQTQRIHERYLHAGVDVITTNAFRTNHRTLKQVDWEAVVLPDAAPAALKSLWQRHAWEELEETLTRVAVKIAQCARAQSGRQTTCIAGNLAPLEDCFSPQSAPSKADAYLEHLNKARTLATAGVDLLLIETMNTIHEADAALDAALETGLPVWVSFVCRGGPELFSGEPLVDAVRMVLNKNHPSIAVVMVNCCFPEEIKLALPVLADALGGTTLRFGAYANLEAPNTSGVWRRRTALNARTYLKQVRDWIALGASVVGGCCGSTPDDLALLCAGLREQAPLDPAS